MPSKCTFALPLLAAALVAAAPSTTVKPTIVLVHGAFADAASWSNIIPILIKDGYNVVAVENPLQSLKGDIDNTRRVIDDQSAPVVVVGHSYGGAVITGAAAGDAKVKALVYVAALAPDLNEPVGELLNKYPTDFNNALRPDKAGYITVDGAKFHELFAADLPADQAAVLEVTQKPITGDSFTATVPQVAWKTIPSWYVVSKRDKAINPDLERFYAKRMNAHTTEIDASHIGFVTHPKEVAAVIEQAAAATEK